MLNSIHRTVEFIETSVSRPLESYKPWQAKWLSSWLETIMRECAERLILAGNGLSSSTATFTGAAMSAQHTTTTATAGATAATPMRSTTPITSALEEQRKIWFLSSGRVGSKASVCD